VGVVNPVEHLDLVEELLYALHERIVAISTQTAAVDLLAKHQVWLARADFAPFIRRGHYHGEPTASIRWRAAHTALRRGQLPCSASEAAILRIAASLATGIPVNLRDALDGLDHHDIAHVIRALGRVNDTWPITTKRDDHDW
jgi:hypothetical protein